MGLDICPPEPNPADGAREEVCDEGSIIASGSATNPGGGLLPLPLLGAHIGRGECGLSASMEPVFDLTKPALGIIGEGATKASAGTKNPPVAPGGGSGMAEAFGEGVLDAPPDIRRKEGEMGRGVADVGPLADRLASMGRGECTEPGMIGRAAPCCGLLPKSSTSSSQSHAPSLECPRRLRSDPAILGGGIGKLPACGLTTPIPVLSRCSSLLPVGMKPAGNPVVGGKGLVIPRPGVPMTPVGTNPVGKPGACACERGLEKPGVPAMPVGIKPVGIPGRDGMC